MSVNYEPGAELPELKVTPDRFLTVRYAGASGDFNPIHIDEDFARMVHGAQEFAWGPLVVAGDEITTECELVDASQRGGMGFFTFETRSVNQDGERVCTGTWTNIVRGE